jgi:hypothetical protein
MALTTKCGKVRFSFPVLKETSDLQLKSFHFNSSGYFSARISNGNAPVAEILTSQLTS